jgi:Spy/CpxP family protein refolding chaperone
MRTFGKIVLTLGAAALLSGPALAQGPRFGGGMGMGGGLGLLTNKGVQQELKLDSQQVEKATKLAEEMGAKRREQFQSLQSLGEEERRAKMQEMTKTFAEENRKVLKELLKPEQYQRYEQIGLQQRGVTAFDDPDVQKKLNLTDDQKSKLKDMGESYRNDMREIFQSSQGNFQEAGAKVSALRKERMEKAAAVLTDDQRKAWKEMTGEPFEVKFEPRPGGGR